MYYFYIYRSIRQKNSSSHLEMLDFDKNYNYTNNLNNSGMPRERARRQYTPNPTLTRNSETNSTVMTNTTYFDDSYIYDTIPDNFSPNVYDELSFTRPIGDLLTHYHSTATVDCNDDYLVPKTLNYNSNTGFYIPAPFYRPRSTTNQPVITII